MRHLPRESNKSSLDSHLRRLAAVFVQGFRNLRPGEAHFDARDDGLAILGLQSRESFFVPLEHLASNRLFKRGRVGRRSGTPDRLCDLSAGAVDFIENSTMESLSNVPLKCVLVSWLDLVNPK